VTNHYYSITPESLREAATRLWHPASSEGYGGHGICEAYRGPGTFWLLYLMRECGASIRPGGYMRFGKDVMTEEQHQEIRFMFLHFMALYLEDG
jgi:hypothetical protein